MIIFTSYLIRYVSCDFETLATKLKVKVNI